MPTPNPNFKSKKKPLSEYARYSAIGFQMAAIIFLSAWGGTKLDAYLGNKIPFFTLLFSMASIVISLYYFIKSFRKKE